jgi:hypothetical protein
VVDERKSGKLQTVAADEDRPFSAAKNLEEVAGDISFFPRAIFTLF